MIELILIVCLHQLNSGMVEFSENIEVDPTCNSWVRHVEWLGLVIVSAGVCSQDCVDVLNLVEGALSAGPAHQ